MGLTNVILMIPFCRTPKEGKCVLAEMAKHGLVRGENGLQVYVMCELPSNVTLADEFSGVFDGFSIGSNDLTQLTTAIVSTITAHSPGYLDRDLEQIVGLQTDKPWKRAIMPFGGIRVVKASLEAYGYQLDTTTEEIFTKYRKTHNDGVFDAYTCEMRLARHSGIITGLPDAYGRGHIIGDYRRVALYGCDRLIDDTKAQLQSLEIDTNDYIQYRVWQEDG